MRITHLPTGIAVAVQQERSQHLSTKAIQMLKARLYELELQKREAERLEAEANAAGSLLRRYVAARNMSSHFLPIMISDALVFT